MIYALVELTTAAMSQSREQADAPATTIQFVHHDGGNMKTTSQRRIVFSHIQKVYLKSKRLEDGQFTLRGRRTRKPIAAHPADDDDDPSADQTHPRRMQATAAVGPLTILRRGNSDPFESLAVSVTPRVNEIMSFVKDYFLPACYVTDSPAWIRAFGADKEWDDSVEVLREECCAPAFMLTYMTIMANMSQGDVLVTEQLTLKGKSTSALRTRI